MTAGPTVAWTARALLLDLDGVLVDSTASVERVWRDFAARHGIDESVLFAGLHGVRGSDTVRRVAPHLDAAAEVAVLEAAEIGCADDDRALDGAAALLALPHDRVAVVTSCPVPLMRARLSGAGLTAPATVVTGDAITYGKPHPEGYRTGAARLGVDPAECVVVEDAPAGVAAGRAAGMRVIAVATTTAPGDLAAADVVVASTAAVHAVAVGDGVHLVLDVLPTG